MSQNYLKAKISHERNYHEERTEIAKFIKNYKEFQNDFILLLDKAKAQACLKQVRALCPGEFIDLGTYAIRHYQGEFYTVFLNSLSEKKLWRVINTFTPAIYAVQKYGVTVKGTINRPYKEYFLKDILIMDKETIKT